MIRTPKTGLSASQKWVVALLFIVPLAIMLGKWSLLPTSRFLTRSFSLSAIPAEVSDRAEYILLVPLGAVFVVFCRLTLGIRVMGPFRSILLAMAFHVVGIIEGLIFLTAIMAIILIIRPELRLLRVGYFGRVSVILSLVVIVMALGLLAGNWLGASPLHRMARLPIVVLCLMGEGLARTLVREGPRSAVWRGVTTALLAVAITLVSEVGAIRDLLLRFPELLVLEVGCVVFIARYLDLRVLEWMNPPVVKQSARRKGRPQKHNG